MQEPGTQGSYGYSDPLPQPTGAMPQYQVQSSRRVLKSIGVGSAAKIGAVTSALMWAVLGLFFVMFGSILASALPNGQGGAGAAGGIMMYIIMIPMYAIFGGIGGALYALFYNLVAGWVGGLEIEVS